MRHSVMTLRNTDRAKARALERMTVLKSDALLGSVSCRWFWCVVGSDMYI